MPGSPSPDSATKRLAELAELAGKSPERVTLRLEHLPDDEPTRLLLEAHVAVLPFRRSTTSGTAVLALCHGLPIVIPDLPGLAELPAEAVFRYDGTVQGLTGALTEAILAEDSRLARMSAAAEAYSASMSWHEIAGQTLNVMRASLNHGNGVVPELATRPLAARK